MGNLINRCILSVCSVLLLGLCAWQRWSIRRNGQTVGTDGKFEPLTSVAYPEIEREGPETDPRFMGKK